MKSFEDSHYILLFRYIYGAQLIQWFCYSKHLHVNRNYRPNGTATSLSPKCYSANVPLDFCTTADFEMKYFLMKAFWVIPDFLGLEPKWLSQLKTNVNPRPAGGGSLNAPLRFFEASENTAALRAAGFSPTLPPIFSATLVKFSTQCHMRSGHQVRSS